MKNLILLGSILFSSYAFAADLLTEEASNLPSCEVSGFTQQCYKYDAYGNGTLAGNLQVPGCKISCPETKTPSCFAGVAPKTCDVSITAPVCKCN